MSVNRLRAFVPMLLPLTVFGLLFAIWEYAVSAGWLRWLLFSPPSRLVSSAVELVVDGVPVGKTLVDHLSVTVARIAGDFLAAVMLASRSVC